MIYGIGIDAVEIERFKAWGKRSSRQLSRIFSLEEIHYCMAEGKKCSERFAARFAAKEALFKALSQSLPKFSIPFLTLCKKSVVISGSTGPRLDVAWKDLGLLESTVLLSITHTRTLAIAMVSVCEKNTTEQH